MNSIPTSLLISALGGAVAALFLRASFRLLGKVWMRYKRLAEYVCADAIPEPPDNSDLLPGILIYGRGDQVADPRAKHKRAWEHNRKATEKNRAHTLYGPHVNDFGKPGFYRVRFRIYGEGFSSDDNNPTIVLDVIERPAYHHDESLIHLGQRVVKGKELSRGRYKWFDVYCYVTGSGIYEYRCRVQEKYLEKEDRLRFDVIRVHAHVPIWEVF